MQPIRIAVEGPSDVAVVRRVLESRSLAVEERGIFIMGGKPKLDPKIRSYNQAAAHFPWLVLRDGDNDERGCPVALRESKLRRKDQHPAFCFRIAVRSVEAWLLADHQAFASYFSVARSRIPSAPEETDDPKRALVDLCRSSSRSDIRRALVPSQRSGSRVGPEYVSRISDYARNAWRPNEAAVNAPSLRGMLDALDGLLSSGIWH